MMQAMNFEQMLWPQSGTYVLAISGGIDSLVLLDLFTSVAKDKNYHLVVAHFDHAMRPDSFEDALFVEIMASTYGLKYRGGRANSKLSSEDDARIARYRFLHVMATEEKADGVITAHHLDDLIETSLLNLARGTGRSGLVPFEAETPIRPLKYISRKEIESFARDNNQNISNPRNFIRHQLAPAETTDWVGRYLANIIELQSVNEAISEDLKSIIDIARVHDGFSWPRAIIAELTLAELSEVLMAAVGESARRVELDRRLVEELSIFAKMGKVGRRRPLREGWEMRISRDTVDLKNLYIPAVKA
jgi:tRNA(Ile)-lysidine synthetase-like protein